MKKRMIFALGFILFLAAISTACAKAEPAMTPQELIDASVAHMNELAGFEFSLNYDGAPVVMDKTTNLAFTSATGQYNAPDAVSAKVKAASSSITLEVSLIAAQGSQWITNPLTGAWTELTGEFALRPTRILNGDQGLFAVIGSGMTDPLDLGDEELPELPGVTLKHLKGLISGDAVNEVTGGMVDSGGLSVDLWIDPGTYELNRITITDSAGGMWQLDFWNFGSTFDIQPPQ